MHISTLTRAAFIAVLLASAPAIGHAQVYMGVGVNIAPPIIPVYTQPPAPAPNYLWQPGYWAWGPGGYYWVPGTWVAAPAVGMLWTPGYWGWGGSAYYWHPGYWGRTVGFYGGINYGFGYFGAGYVGGGWNGGVFRYNTAITNVNRVVIHNTYIDKTVVYRNNNNHTGYNGGHGGIQAHPTQGQISARDHGMAPTSEQQYHEQLSGQDRNHLSTVNHGQPNTAAVTHPYNQNNPPAHSAPITNSDRQAAQQHVAPQNGNHPPPNGNHPQQNGKPPHQEQ
ncbi:MAG TPA: YXWGXW repeat-containing protein [Candidatus Cybelea sp.]|jgi:hypothetical protein|nr:YXWGXW repeat-containing protein [Candidatus Cybelea sp.]